MGLYHSLHKVKYVKMFRTVMSMWTLLLCFLDLCHPSTDVTVLFPWSDNFGDSLLPTQWSLKTPSMAFRASCEVTSKPAVLPAPAFSTLKTSPFLGPPRHLLHPCLCSCCSPCPGTVLSVPIPQVCSSQSPSFYKRQPMVWSIVFPACSLAPLWSVLYSDTWETRTGSSSSLLTALQGIVLALNQGLQGPDNLAPACLPAPPGTTLHLPAALDWH